MNSKTAMQLVILAVVFVSAAAYNWDKIMVVWRYVEPFWPLK